MNVNWVMVPVRNNLELTLTAMRTFLEQTPEVGKTVRVLVIDNGSTDGTAQWLRSMYPQVVAVTNTPGKSVAKSWNQGLQAIFSNSRDPQDAILVCNNDVELRPNTYRSLLRHGGGFVTAVGNNDPGCVRDYQIPPIGLTEKVKIGRFLEDNIKLKGVVHIGTNDGYEIQWYQKLGLKVIGFEAYSKAAQVCQDRYPEAIIRNIALGESEGSCLLHVTHEGGGGSSFKKSLMPETFVGDELVNMTRLDLCDIGLDYDCLVIDVQGMELEVLRGCGEQLKQFKCLNVECSREPHYEGEAPAQEVIDWLKERGFTAITPISEHDDILFVRNDVLNVRPHPDFSCFLIRRWVWDKVGKFDENYKGAFCEDWDYHCRLHKAGIDAVCINLPFYHVGSATIKSYSAQESEALCKQADLNREYFKEKWGFAGGSKEYSDFFLT